MRQQSLGMFAFQSLGFPGTSNFLYEETNRLFTPWIDDPQHLLGFHKSPIEKQQVEQVGVIGVKQVRYVNEKQWERIMKRRVQKQLQKMRNIRQGNDLQQQEIAAKKKYKYQSRHLHAERRVRNQKGRFIKTKQDEVGEKIKKKRGRKSIKQKLLILEQQKVEEQKKMICENIQNMSGTIGNQNPVIQQ